MRDRAAMLLRPLSRVWIPRAVLLLMALLSFGCNRNHSGQLPESSGEPVVVAKEPVKGFTLVRAYPDQRDGELALVLNFRSRWQGLRNSTLWCVSSRVPAITMVVGHCPMTPRHSVILMLRQTSTIPC